MKLAILSPINLSPGPTHLSALPTVLAHVLYAVTGTPFIGGLAGQTIPNSVVSIQNPDGTVSSLTVFEPLSAIQNQIN